MVKKACVVLLVAVFVLGCAFSAEALVSGDGYKIKRLVKQLYDKPRAMDAQRELENYGQQVVVYVAPLLKDKNNDSVRVAALNILQVVGDPSVEDEVVVLLKDPNQRIRREAANTLSVIAHKPSTIEPLKRLLSDYSADVRYSAIKALAKLAPKEETDFFIAALGDYEPRVRMFAVIALGKIKAKEAIPSLTQLVRDPDPGVRMQVANALAEIGTQDCLQPMVWLLQDPVPEVKIAAVEKLYELKVQGVDEQLVEAANNTDPRVASRAITALGLRKSPEALATAKAHIDDEHMSVKLASIRVIGKVGSAQDKAELQPLLDAESSKVRKQTQSILDSEAGL